MEQEPARPWATQPGSRSASAEWNCYNKVNGFYMGGDPVVAHREALEWALTGNQANADKAIQILNAWAGTMQSIHVCAPPEVVGQDKLAAGACLAQLCNAAELIAYGGPDGKSSDWSSDDIQKFKTMLQLPYNTMKGFYSGYNGNWDMLMMDSMISMAVFLDDHNMFDEILQHYIVGQTPNGGLPNYVSATGQCQETYHATGAMCKWGLGNAIAICEVAWKQGVDIYCAYDNRLMNGLEYTAKFNLRREQMMSSLRGQRRDQPEKPRQLCSHLGSSLPALRRAPGPGYALHKTDCFRQ